MCSLLALQPHTSRLQCATSRQTKPYEGITASSSVHSTVGTILVPESAASDVQCTVSWPRIVVSVICGKHHAVLVAECISAGVTRVPRHLQLIVVPLWQLPIESLKPTLNSAHERLKKLDPLMFCWISKGTQLATEHTLTYANYIRCYHFTNTWQTDHRPRNFKRINS